MASSRDQILSALYPQGLPRPIRDALALLDEVDSLVMKARMLEPPKKRVLTPAQQASLQANRERQKREKEKHDALIISLYPEHPSTDAMWLALRARGIEVHSQTVGERLASLRKAGILPAHSSMTSCAEKGKDVIDKPRIAPIYEDVPAGVPPMAEPSVVPKEASIPVPAIEQPAKEAEPRPTPKASPPKKSMDVRLKEVLKEDSDVKAVAHQLYVEGYNITWQQVRAVKARMAREKSKPVPDIEVPEKIMNIMKDLRRLGHSDQVISDHVMVYQRFRISPVQVALKLGGQKAEPIKDEPEEEEPPEEEYEE